MMKASRVPVKAEADLRRSEKGNLPRTHGTRSDRCLVVFFVPSSLGGEKIRSWRLLCPEVLRRPAAARLIKEVLAPGLVGAPEVANDLPVHVKVVCLRAAEQSHSGVFGGAITFSVVARAAASDQIVPSRIASARTRMDMVQRQFLRRKHSPAVLTRVVVAQQDVLARKALSLKRDVYVFDESDDRRERH